MISNKKAVYDYHADMRTYKWSGKETLNKCELSGLPDYLKKNISK